MNGQNRRINILLFCALVMVCAGSEQAARAESANSLARKGNEHYNHEHYPQATEAYRQALMRDPTSPVIQYNLGTSLAKEGQHGEANQILQQAAQVPTAPNLSRRDSFFNLGVSLSDTAKTQPGQTGPSGQGGKPNDLSAKNNALQEKITKLNQSLGAFRQAILTDPKDDEAKYNYEIVKAMLRQAQQEQKQQQMNQDKNQQNKNQKDKQDKDKNQQNQQQQKEEQKDKQQQDGQNQQDKQNQQKDQQQKGEQEKDRQDKSSDREKDQQKEGEEAKDQPGAPQQPKPQKKEGQNEKPQQANARPGAEQPKQEPLKPEQMDALRLLNLLEAEKPEQFKELFRFQGKRVERKPDKDW